MGSSFQKPKFRKSKLTDLIFSVNPNIDPYPSPQQGLCPVSIHVETKLPVSIHVETKLSLSSRNSPWKLRIRSSLLSLLPRHVCRLRLQKISTHYSHGRGTLSSLTRSAPALPLRPPLRGQDAVIVLDTKEDGSHHLVAVGRHSLHEILAIRCPVVIAQILILYVALNLFASSSSKEETVCIQSRSCPYCMSQSKWVETTVSEFIRDRR